MRVTLLDAEALAPPPHFPREAVAAPGEPVALGRSPAATLCVPGDGALAPLHALVVCYADGCRVFDVAGRGLRVDGAAAHEARLREGSVVRAGDTAVRAVVLPDGPPDRPGSDDRSGAAGGEAPAGPALGEALEETLEEALAPDRAAALAHLRAAEAPLYAVLDGAQRGAAVAAARAAGELAAPLPDDAEALDYADVAPWLVRLAPESPLLARLFRVAWGTAECVFLSSARPFAEVRDFLRGLYFEGPGYAHPAAWRPRDARDAQEGANTGSGPAEPGVAASDAAAPGDPEPDAFFRFYDPLVLAGVFASPGADLRPLFGGGTVVAWYCEAYDEARDAVPDDVRDAAGRGGDAGEVGAAAWDGAWEHPDDPDGWADVEEGADLPSPAAFVEFRAPAEPPSEATPGAQRGGPAHPGPALAPWRLP